MSAFDVSKIQKLKRICLAASAGIVLFSAATDVANTTEIIERTPVPTPQPVGVSAKITNQVSGSLGERLLKTKDSVFANEAITAGPESFGQILLNDDSKVLVGENSTISLDEFVLGNRGFADGTIKVSKGAFRFITGNSPKGFLKVESPVSTIGVRGTLFDVYVTDSGVTRVVLFRGEVEVCSGGQCVVTDNACDVVEATGEGVDELPYLRSGEREEENEVYELANLQKRFNKAWRAPTFDCSVRAFFDPKVRTKRANDRNDDRGGMPNETPSFDPGNPCASLRLPDLLGGTLLAQTIGPPGIDPCA